MQSLDPNEIELLDPDTKALLQGKTPADCIRMVAECNRSSRLRMAGHLKTIHPSWSDEQIRTGVLQWLTSSVMSSSSNS